MPTGLAKVYDFKAVGQKLQERQVQREIATRAPPIGIQTPLTIAGDDGLFKMHTDPLSNIKDNLKNLILTNHGERLGLFDFGANLRPLVFELSSDDAATDAITRISTAVRKYMPFIELQTFEAFEEKPDSRMLAKIGVRITYSVPSLNVTEQKIEVILYAGG